MKFSKRFFIWSSIAVIVFFFFVYPKHNSKRVEKFIGEDCIVIYGPSTPPMNVYGKVMKIDDSWVVVRVYSKGSVPVSFDEYWIPRDKLISISKHYIENLK